MSDEGTQQRSNTYCSMYYGLCNDLGKGSPSLLPTRDVEAAPDKVIFSDQVLLNFSSIFILRGLFFTLDNIFYYDLLGILLFLYIFNFTSFDIYKKRTLFVAPRSDFLLYNFQTFNNGSGAGKGLCKEIQFRPLNFRQRNFLPYMEI